MKRETYDKLIAQGKLNPDGQPYYMLYDDIVWHLQTGRQYYKSVCIDEYDLAYQHTLHQYIWIKANGDIPPHHVIHFKDKNPYNLTLSNLECLLPSQHAKYHPVHFTPEQLKKISEGAKRSMTPERRAKLSQQKIGNHYQEKTRSAVTKQRISAARKRYIQRLYLLPYLNSLVEGVTVHSYSHDKQSRQGDIHKNISRWFNRIFYSRRK